MEIMAKIKRPLQRDNLKLVDIKPLTNNQANAFDSKKHLVMSGVAGTGKTFISLYLAMSHVQDKDIDSVLIVRSTVPTRDIGFLPGTDAEKVAVYEDPYIDICAELFDRGDAYEILKKKYIINFSPTSFIRGTTRNNTVIIVDEVQNMTFHELDSIITRVGENCRVFFCGDFAQSDLKDNGLKPFLKILERMQEFDTIEFGVDDIVRSEFVKNYIITKLSIENESRTK
jgi:phosphate starvation-inducible protein PhoH